MDFVPLSTLENVQFLVIVIRLAALNCVYTLFWYMHNMCPQLKYIAKLRRLPDVFIVLYIYQITITILLSPIVVIMAKFAIVIDRTKIYVYYRVLNCSTDIEIYNFFCSTSCLFYLLRILNKLQICLYSIIIEQGLVINDWSCCYWAEPGN